MDIYFELNPMDERDAIKMETIHLDGEVYDLWFYGMNNLDYYQVVIYEEFT